MPVEVSGDALQAALARAITDAVTPENQRAIFQDALEKYLFAKDKNGDKHGPITEAFRRALDDATRTVAQEVVNTPECRERIRVELHKALDLVFEEPKFRERMFTNLVNAFTRGY